MIRYEPDLYRYLHRLDGLNFIQPNTGYGLVTIEQQHRDDERLPVPPDQRPQFDLKEYVHITGEGGRYLGILSLVRSSARPKSQRTGSPVRAIRGFNKGSRLSCDDDQLDGRAVPPN
jgi:hypothetical protein